MPKTRPALAIVIGGALCGAVIAQAVPTDLAGTSPRPWKPVEAQAYPEIVGITYETLPGAASDPYNYTPHRATLRIADMQYQLDDAAPGYSEPEYDEADYRNLDPQIIEDDGDDEDPDVVALPEPVMGDTTSPLQEDQSVG